MTRARYYAVKAGRVPGVYKTWLVPPSFALEMLHSPSACVRPEAQRQVSGFSRAQHKAFSSLELAVEWSDVPRNQLASWVEQELQDDGRGGGSLFLFEPNVL